MKHKFCKLNIAQAATHFLLLWKVMDSNTSIRGGEGIFRTKFAGCTKRGVTLWFDFATYGGH